MLLRKVEKKSQEIKIVSSKELKEMQVQGGEDRW